MVIVGNRSLLPEDHVGICNLVLCLKFVSQMCVSQSLSLADGQVQIGCLDCRDISGVLFKH